jgi:hypothetical protein
MAVWGAGHSSVIKQEAMGSIPAMASLYFFSLFQLAIWLTEWELRVHYLFYILVM